MAKKAVVKSSRASSKKSVAKKPAKAAKVAKVAKAAKKAAPVKAKKGVAVKKATVKPVILHGIWLSGPTYKVGLMLALSGHPFSYVHMNLQAGEHKQPEFLAKNRFGQVPCLIDGKVSLCQSSSILEHLAEKTGKFAGRSAEERARIREWMFWEFDRLAPWIYRARGVKRGFRQATSDIVALYDTEGKAGLAVLDSALAGRDWLVGKRATIADIDVYGAVNYAEEGGFDLSAYPNIKAWMARFEALKRFGKPEDVLPKENRA